MRQIIILGGGTAGSILANRLSRELPTKEYQITVVDRNNLHHYQPGYLFVPFGMYRPRSVVKPRSRFLPAGVQFVPDTILRVDPETKTVELATQKLQYDYLIITTGCTIRPDQVPGMSDPRVWRRSVFDFYTLSGATKLHRALRDFPGGKLVVHTSEVPIKCPVAPLEFTFLADWFFFRRRRRFDVDITFVTPLDREDLHLLGSTMDDCMDLVDEAGDCIVLYHVGVLPQACHELVDILKQCAELTAQAMPRLKSLKDLESYWVKINELENHGDQTYRAGIGRLFEEEMDPISLIKRKEIIERMEAAIDAFESLANTVESIAVRES